MTIAVTNIGTASDKTGAATVAITVGVGGVPAGSLIVLLTNENGASTATGTAADSALNTYSTATSRTDGASLDAAIIFYVPNASALVNTNTITYTKKAAANTAAISAFYATGIATASPLDTAATATATGTSTTPSVTSGTPAAAGDLFVGFVGNQGSSGTFTQDSTNDAWATPPNEAVPGTAGTDARVDGGNVVNAAATTRTYAPTFSVSKAWVALIVAFKAPPAFLGQPWQLMGQMGALLAH